MYLQASLQAGEQLKCVETNRSMKKRRHWARRRLEIFSALLTGHWICLARTVSVAFDSTSRSHKIQTHEKNWKITDLFQDPLISLLLMFPDFEVMFRTLVEVAVVLRPLSSSLTLSKSASLSYPIIHLDNYCITIIIIRLTHRLG